jgi:20S proteasome alpha/beta subunit
MVGMRCIVFILFLLLQLVQGGPFNSDLWPRDWARHLDWAQEDASQQSQQQLPLPEDELQAHGTTTLAFTFAGGVLVAVDSRASIGKYVGSRTTRKVFPISSHMVATMAGGAADCTYWIRLCTRASKLHEYSAGAPLSVGSVATMLARRLREMRHASE